MVNRGIEKRLAKLEDASGIRKAGDDDCRLREASRLVREAQKMAAGHSKPVKGQHSLDLAAAFLLVAGEDRHRELLNGVAREGIERWKRINETGIWIAHGKWWDNREDFSEWLWEAVERDGGTGNADRTQAAADLAVLRANIGAFREPTPPERSGTNVRRVLLID